MIFPEALITMKLKSDFSLEELNRSFRELVKTYHPDKNPDNQDWAHEKMVLLNESYKLLIEYRSKNPVISTESIPLENVFTQEAPTDPAFPYYFSEAIQLFLSGICLFYEYGLDNPHLRKEGTRRFRYREAIKTIFKSIELIMEIRKMELNDETRQYFEVVMRFILLFYQDIKKDSTFNQQGSFERQVVGNNKLLFRLIHAALFPNRTNSQFFSKDNLYLCYMTYMKLIKMAIQEDQNKEILLKVSILDALLNFIEVKNSGQLSDFFD